MRFFRDRPFPMLRGVALLICLLSLSLFFGGLGCRLEASGSGERESALSPVIEDPALYAFLWKDEAP